MLEVIVTATDGRFVIESDMFELKDVVMEIFNEKGQLIWNRKIRDDIGTMHESVDHSTLFLFL